MKKLLLFALCCSFACELFADDATNIWRNVLGKCAASDEIKKNTLFFGVSNTIGPGSVWTYDKKNGAHLLYPLSSAAPDAADAVIRGKVASCSGSSATDWDVKLGLPFTTGVTPINVDLNATLSHATSAKVSVTGFSLDQLVEVPWEVALSKIDKTSHYVKHLTDANVVIQGTSVTVTGLKAVFTFQSDLSADAQVKFKGKVFTIGTATGASPTGAASSTIMKTNKKNTAAPSATPTKAASSTTAADVKPSDGAAAAITCEATGNPTATPANSSKALPSDAATVQVDVTASNQITVCSDGPVYLLGTYIKLVAGQPNGGIIQLP